MKAFVVAAVICAVAILVKADLTEEQRAKLKNHYKECLAETKADEELVNKARKGEFTDDQKLKEHIFCVFKRINILDESGEIKLDALKTKLGHVATEDEVDKLVKKCAVKKDNGPETAYQMLKCYAESGKHIL